ncbi:hypothetical protein CEXT_65361 [Caerostris extrusa]|uniref:Uncharacterized protein n=1 Tax=Caerostris extrusa TaxID=172846 RepID=A0AAV4V2W3_CAEEX|nr:hypothetical protein CEXT_65361 [Caerostris extrusa]
MRNDYFKDDVWVSAPPQPQHDFQTYHAHPRHRQENFWLNVTCQDSKRISLFWKLSALSASHFNPRPINIQTMIFTYIQK